MDRSQLPTSIGGGPLQALQPGQAGSSNRDLSRMPARPMGTPWQDLGTQAVPSSITPNDVLMSPNPWKANLGAPDSVSTGSFAPSPGVGGGGLPPGVQRPGPYQMPVRNQPNPARQAALQALLAKFGAVTGGMGMG
jgi:hypothetical protein